MTDRRGWLRGRGDNDGAESADDGDAEEGRMDAAKAAGKSMMKGAAGAARLAAERAKETADRARPVGQEYLGRMTDAAKEAVSRSETRGWDQPPVLASAAKVVADRVTAAARETESPIPMPAPLSDTEVHAALDRHVESSRLVSRDAFPEPWTLHHGPAIEFRISRLIESRSVTTKEVTRTRAPRMTGVAKTLDPALPRPQIVEAARYSFLVDGSERTRRCRRCRDGQIRCRTCRGAGQTDCPARVTCARCSGTGQVARQNADGTDPCNECRGRGEETCGRCDGSGRKTCETCRGRKTVPCEDCDSTGELTTYDELSVTRGPEVATFLHGSVPKSVKAQDWQHHSRAGYTPPPGLPNAAAAELEPHLQRHDGEILRSLNVAVLPLTRIEYGNNDPREEAFIVGPQSRVLAPGVKARALGGIARRWLLPALLLTVLITVVIILLVSSSNATDVSLAVGVGFRSCTCPHSRTPRSPRRPSADSGTGYAWDREEQSTSLSELPSPPPRVASEQAWKDRGSNRHPGSGGR